MTKRGLARYALTEGLQILVASFLGSIVQMTDDSSFTALVLQSINWDGIEFWTPCYQEERAVLHSNCVKDIICKKTEILPCNFIDHNLYCIQT